MDPEDNTSHWQLAADFTANDSVRVQKYVSKKTKLCVVIADVGGPLVNGYFCLATEAHDDDGLPHTLEHLVFMGSDDYPYKGILDLIANRCLSSGTNAWTDTDHTCYTMTTVGSRGFLNMFPVYVDHILFPTLTKSGYLTEVHHVGGDGNDAGVVYCEMQGRESSGESRVHLEMARALFPDSGYKSETGGILKNLRETTSHEKVVKYHKEFYRPENLCLIITGTINPEDVFRSLTLIEEKAIAKARSLSAFVRPWQSKVSSLDKAVHKDILFPCDDEDNGLVYVAWRGPSAVTELKSYFAATVMMEYLTESSVSPLKTAFVECEDPLASSVSYSIMEQSQCGVYLTFSNVPLLKISKVEPLLLSTLKHIVERGPTAFDMTRLGVVIHRRISELIAVAENDPHGTVAHMVIGDMLYGHSKEDLEKRLNPQRFFKDLLKEGAPFWIGVLTEILAKPWVVIRGTPSMHLQAEMTRDEQTRVEAQREALGEVGLAAKKKLLLDAVAENEKEAPAEIFEDFAVPGTDSIAFHPITMWNRTSIRKAHGIDLNEVKVPAFFNDVKSKFAYLYAIMDTHTLPEHLRPYLPLFSEMLLESPMQEGDGKLISFEDVVRQLDADVVVRHASLGLSGRRFNSGAFSQYFVLYLLLEQDKYAAGVKWLSDLLHKTVFTEERTKIIATKIENGIAEMKRSGGTVVRAALKLVTFAHGSNQRSNLLLTQQPFLRDVLLKLNCDESKKVIQDLNDLRSHLVRNVVVSTAADFGKLLKPLQPWKDSQFQRENHQMPTFLSDCGDVVPGSRHIIIGLGSVESSFLLRAAPGISSIHDPDLAHLMLFFQYLTQLEGPMWRKIRGAGLSYGYSLTASVEQGLIFFGLTKSTSPFKAYKAANKILQAVLDASYEWSDLEFESAKSSLIFEQVEKFQSVSGVVGEAILSVFFKTEPGYLKNFLAQILATTITDLKIVGQKYVKGLFGTDASRTVMVCHPSKVDLIRQDFASSGVTFEANKNLELFIGKIMKT